MIFSLSGTLTHRDQQFAVIEVGGVGLKVFMSARSLGGFTAGESVKVFSHLHVREDALDLYGFLTSAELQFFELLISVSGVGPRSALAIIDIAPLKDLSAAIKEGRPDLLTRASGVGRKTAERIIVELRNRVDSEESEALVRRMEGDSDLLEALMGLGYRRDQVKAAIGKIESTVSGLEARLKAALKILGNRS